MSTPLNIIFAGTPDFAAQHLQALISSEHNIVAAYCPPDRPSGRGKKLQPCAVKQLAMENNIEVEQPLNFKSEDAVDKLKSYQADVMIVVAYGLLLPTSVLNVPRLGCINVHGSLLPQWRGAAPIQRSLEAGDLKTGVTIMQMDAGLDTGDMLLKASCPISIEDTSATLYDKLANLGPQALIETLDLLANNKATPEKQNNNLASYAKKLEKQEAELDWNLPAKMLHQKIRAYIPWPVSQVSFKENDDKTHQIRVWQASVLPWQGSESPGTILESSKKGILIATGDGALNIETLQLPGKKALAVADILNSRASWFQVGHLITGK